MSLVAAMMKGVFWAYVLGMCCFATPSRALPRTVDAAGRPVRWSDPIVTLRLAPATTGGPDRAAMAGKILAASTAGWESACSAARVALGEPVFDVRGAARDGKSTVVFQRHDWCRNGRASGSCYSPAQLAVTTIHLEEGKGTGAEARLVEVDIEINAVHFDWFGDSPRRARPPVTLETVLAHELGHVFGFEHASDGATTIMSASAHGGASLVGRPTDADRQALCALYPRAPALTSTQAAITKADDAGRANLVIAAVLVAFATLGAVASGILRSGRRAGPRVRNRGPVIRSTQVGKKSTC